MSEKKITPNIDGEMDEFQRLSQDLKRDEDIEVSVDEIVKAFKNAKEETLSDDVWSSLENTESNEIEKGDMDAVMDIAKMYKKTNPKILVKSLKAGDYSRPLILNIDGRHILVAGNTRLSTAAAMGMNPKVFIGKVKKDIKESEEIEGGLADNKSLVQLAKKHGAKNYYHIDVMVKSLEKQLAKGVKVEMEHTNDPEMAKEIAMDHLWEDPKYYNKLKQIEATEMTDASSSGSFSSPAFGTIIKKKDITKIHNMTEQALELDEVTDASSSGAYDTPFGGGGTKGRKNPLKIDGPDSIYKGRAVKDKNFPKWGGPDSVFVKVKEKCKKFPYCNQGNTGAIEYVSENKEIKEAINEISKKYGVPYKEIEKIVLNDINKIFI